MLTLQPERQPNRFLHHFFGKSQSAKKSTVPLPASKSDGSATSIQDRMIASPSDPPHPISHLPIDRCWFKKMPNSDAQQKGTSNTNQTGNLKLTKARHPIDHKSFFRNDFFETCNWIGEQTSKGIKEKAEVLFDVVVDGQAYGQHLLELDHADYRIASQNNVPTWLHWGSELGAYLQSNDHVGDYVTLERTTDGRYALTISSEPDGDFIGPSNIVQQ